MNTQKYVFNSDREFSNKQALNFLLEDKFIENYVWNKVYTKQLFAGLRFPVGKTFEDIAVMYKLFLRANKVAVLSKHFKYFYFQRNNSISNIRKFKNALDCFENYWARYEDLKDNVFIDRQELCVSVLSSFMNISSNFPFKYRERTASFKEKFEVFMAENKNLNGYPLNKSHRLFLKLPFPLFFLMYNDVTRRVMNFLKKALGGSRH